MPCAEACPSQGIIVYGKAITVDDILARVEQDAIFYARSGGGMTLSGGEPLHQPQFALALLREAKKRRIRTAVESCGMAPRAVLLEAAGLLSTVLYDIKHMDGEKHKRYTGVDNKAILDNLKSLLEACPNLPVQVRTPVIPGFNDNDEAAQQIGSFLAGHSNVSFEALAYHRLGTQKYAFLGREYLMGEEPLPQEKTQRFQQVVDETRLRGKKPHRKASS
jgi:glycyl-radical enzyme activating protein family